MSNSGTILSKYTKETYKIDTITDLKIIEKIVKSKDGKKYPIIQGRGAGGQFIFVFPSLDLVVAATAHNKGMGRMLKELPEILIPAFSEN